MPDGTNIAAGVTLAGLAAVPRWVVWRTEPRRPLEKPTKIPKCPRSRRNASCADPDTWGTRAEAEAADTEHPASVHGPGGIGIVLGELGDGRVLCGIDLDRCLDPETKAPTRWASELMERFPTYSEISPSGTGIKLFFFVTALAYPKLRHVLSGNPNEGKDGRKWAWAGGEHSPGIELYLSGRFFTVTGQPHPSSCIELRTMSIETVIWLVHEMAPRFKASDPTAQRTSFTLAPVTEIASDDPLMARLHAAMKSSPRLAQRWDGDKSGLTDATRSGLAFALCANLKLAGFGKTDGLVLMRANRHIADWVIEKGDANEGRELDRLWQNAGESKAAPPEPQPLFRPLPPAEPYPVAALGGLLAKAANAIHALTQAPLAICAQSVLGVASLCAQPFADIGLPTGEVKPCSLFLLTVAESGERKSACDLWALPGVRDREIELRESYETERQSWQNDHDAWTKTRSDILGREKTREAKRQKLDALGAEPDAPLVPMLLISEPTFEGLVKLYKDGLPSLGLFSGEAAGFLGGHGMTEEAKARTAAGLSDLWDGTPIKRVRSGDGAVTLPGRRLSAHLMAQPAIADLLIQDQLISGLGGQGLVNRFLSVVPDTAAGSRLFREPPADATHVIQHFKGEVLARLARTWPGERQILMPRRLPLSTAARTEWIQFQHAVEREIAPGGSMESVRGIGNKLPEHAARLAAVLTLFADPDAEEISSEAMGSGIELAQYYATEAMRLAEGARVSSQVLLADKVRLWLLSNWSESVISLPDVYQHGPNSVREKAKAEKVVRMLEDHGHLYKVTGGCAVRGIKRRDVWRIVGKGVP